MLNLTKYPVHGYKNIYWADKQGNIYNATRKMKTYVINSGYKSLKLHNDTVRKTHTVHRLIAETFIPNPEDKAEVNHIDGDKLNNVVDNLEWATSSENKQHAIATGLKHYNNPTYGLKIGKSSKFRNVSYDKARNRWVGSIRDKGKTYGQKRFDLEVDAALHVDYLIDLHGFPRPKNFS